MPLSFYRDNRTARSTRGFTLLELLVVIAILGTLVTLAIPSMMNHRAEGYCGRVVSDARHALAAMEAYFSYTLEYGALTETEFVPSEKVTVSIASTEPLTIAAVDDSGQCTRGTTYVLTNGDGAWQ